MAHVRQAFLQASVSQGACPWKLLGPLVESRHYPEAFADLTLVFLQLFLWACLGLVTSGLKKMRLLSVVFGSKYT